MASISRADQNCVICFQDFRDADQLAGHDASNGISHVFHVNCYENHRAWALAQRQVPNCPRCRNENADFYVADPIVTTLFKKQILKALSKLKSVPKNEKVERHYVEINCSKKPGASSSEKKIYADDLLQLGLRHLMPTVKSDSEILKTITYLMLFRVSDLEEKIVKIAQGILTINFSTSILLHDYEAPVRPYIDESDVDCFKNDLKRIFSAIPRFVPYSHREPEIQPTFLCSVDSTKRAAAAKKAITGEKAAAKKKQEALPETLSTLQRMQKIALRGFNFVSSLFIAMVQSARVTLKTLWGLLSK